VIPSSCKYGIFSIIPVLVNRFLRPPALIQRIYMPHLGGPTCRSRHPKGL
jgi:hypothetical protein